MAIDGNAAYLLCQPQFCANIFERFAQNTFAYALMAFFPLSGADRLPFLPARPVSHPSRLAAEAPWKRSSLRPAAY
jgi:hypothetical protein